MADTAKYQPPWLLMVVSLAGFLETRIPPHIWLDNVIFGLSLALAVIIAIHAACWFYMLRTRHKDGY